MKTRITPYLYNTIKRYTKGQMSIWLEDFARQQYNKGMDDTLNQLKEKGAIVVESDKAYEVLLRQKGISDAIATSCIEALLKHTMEHLTVDNEMVYTEKDKEGYTFDDIQEKKK